jgi:diguanylate cyclase (GGDEF)-like protein/PAS domain S-box-containing protein
MVGQHADGGDSQGRRTAVARADGVPRRDLEVGSLASWSRSLDEQRRELLAGVGHELKTPLSIVLGLCGRLLADARLADAHVDVERIRANAYVLLDRVEELLLVSRLEGGYLDLDLRAVDVADLVRRSCDGFTSVAELREQRIVVQAPQELTIRIDDAKLLSVVSNLLANALKYAPAGGLVRCTVAAVGERLRIEVADSGPGVAAGLREMVFERFRQGPGSAGRPGGAGLGLSIVRDLVEAHGGTVALSDAPEGGALFVVELPLRTEAAEGSSAATPTTIDVVERQRPTVERLRAELAATDRREAPSQLGGGEPDALVVTADATLGTFVEELIAHRYAVRHATDPLGAARMIATRRPDAVLADGVGGRAIAALRRRLGGVPLLVLAAAAEDVPGLMRAGADDCVVKPFAAEELGARLDALVRRGHAAAHHRSALAGLDRAFQVAPVAMALLSQSGRFLRVNRALCALLGFEAEELLVCAVDDLTHPDDLPDEDVRRRMVLEQRLIADRGTWRLARADGTYVTASITASLVTTAEGSEHHLLWHVAEAPGGAAGGAGVLAGPPGRRAFERAVRQQLLRCRRYGEQAAVVRCSLEGLDDVRAAHGPDAVDRLVATIVDAVRRRLRSTDVVAYLGGREIAALLAHADLDAAQTTASAIREAAESQRVASGDEHVGTGAEVGVASLARAGSPGRAFLAAGIALPASDGPPGTLSRLRRRGRSGGSGSPDARAERP